MVRKSQSTERRVLHDLQHLAAGFTEPHHQPGFGFNIRIDPLNPLKKFKRPLIVRHLAHLRIQPFDGLDVMIDHCRPGGVTVCSASILP